MAIKIAINGYGRIGRNVLRAIHESGRNKDFDVVAVNDLGDAETNAHLTQYDTAHGKFPGTVVVEGGDLVVNGDRVKVFAERDPSKLPWGDLGVDVVLECTGLFTSKAKAGAHIAGGAKKVVISAPGGSDVDGTFVYGVNHDQLTAGHQVISNASCTTNCLAPLAKVLHDKIGIVHGLMTTIHAYTNDQVLTDVYHSDLRRARSATMSQIPTKTGAAAAVGLVLPELNGKLDGFAMRVPTINVSVVDLSFVAARATSKDEIDSAVNEAANAQGHSRRQHQAAGVDRLQSRLAQLDLRQHADPGDGWHAGEGAGLVRQRVGLFQPHARHDPGADGGQVGASTRHGRKKPRHAGVFSFGLAPVGGRYPRSLSRSRISVSSFSSFEGSGGAAGASSAFFCMLFIALITMKIAKATMVKSNTVCRKAPYFSMTAGAATVPSAAITASLSVTARSEKFTPPISRPSGGITMPSTSDDTILPNAAPITTPTARSTTLPRMANVLNSLIRLMHTSSSGLREPAL